MVRAFFALLLTLVLPISSLSGDQGTDTSTVRMYKEPGTEPPEHPLDMLHMRLEVRFEPLKKLVHGKVTHVFTPLRSRVDSAFFNGPDIRIHEATMDGRRIATRESREGITVYFNPPLAWDRRDSITFLYDATPRKGLYFVGWDDPRGLSRKQIWTQGQGVDNRYWFPCYDEQNDKLTTETIVTFDSAYRVLSNGRKVSQVDNGDGTTTWHYRMSHPHATYLVMLGIGNYGIRTVTTKTGVPVQLWYYPGQEERIGPTYLYSAACVDFVAGQTGVPFPWESYANIPVQDFLYGAMENTTATVFGDFYYVDRRAFLDKSYVAVDAHELAHQWFGDFVTGRSGGSAWLHESFATFYAKLFQKSVFGEDWYEWERRQEQDAAIAADATARLPILHSAAGSARVYQKGSAVLDMMFSTFGEEECRRVIKHYLLQHAYGSVETNDLLQAFQDVLGVTADWFFDEWIFRGGEPHYQVSFGNGIFTVRQIHERDELIGLFRMPILFEVHYADGSVDSVRTIIREETERVAIPNPKRKPVAFALFDPGSRVVKQVTWERPFSMLQAQAAHAPRMIDRYDAIRAMRAVPLPQKEEDLFRAYYRESFHAIKSEIVLQLANDTAPRTVALLRAAARDADPLVRGSVIRSLGMIPDSLRAACEELLRDSSYTTVAAALGKLCAQYPGDAPRYLEVTRNDEGTGNSVRVLWHAIRAQGGDEASLRALEDYAGVSYEFRTRINALEALQQVNVCSDRLLPHLFSAMTHFNARLRGPADTVCAFFLRQPDARERILRYYHARSWTAPEREFLLPVLGQGTGP